MLKANTAALLWLSCVWLRSKHTLPTLIFLKNTDQKYSTVREWLTNKRWISEAKQNLQEGNRTDWTSSVCVCGEVVELDSNAGVQVNMHVNICLCRCVCVRGCPFTSLKAAGFSWMWDGIFYLSRRSNQSARQRWKPPVTRLLLPIHCPSSTHHYWALNPLQSTKTNTHTHTVLMKSDIKTRSNAFWLLLFFCLHFI